MPAETHSHRGPIDRLEVERIVREQLSEILEVDPAVITPEARGMNDGIYNHQVGRRRDARLPPAEQVDLG